MYKRASQFRQHSSRESAKAGRGFSRHRQASVPQFLRDAARDGITVRGKILRREKSAGFIVEIAGSTIEAFCPRSHMRPLDPTEFELGRIRATVQDYRILEVSPRSVVVSRRAVVDEAQWPKLTAAFREHNTVVGSVRSFVRKDGRSVVGFLVEVLGVVGYLPVHETETEAARRLYSPIRPGLRLQVRIASMDSQARTLRFALAVNREER